METRLLEYFVAVAQEGGFTRAAERCHAAQSTVSAGIRALESDLGVVLFERDTRRVTLSATGALVLPVARELLDQVGRLRDVASDDGVLRGTLRVGTLTNVVAGMRLSSVLGRFQAQHPGVDLRLSPSPTGSAGLARDLADGRIDLAFLGGAPTHYADLEAERLGQSLFVAILPSGHPLAERDVVPLAELARLPFIDSPVGFGNRTALDTAIAAQGLERRTTIEIADVAQMPLFVAARLGVAVMPRSLVPDGVGGVDLHPLDTVIEWELLVATRHRPSAAARALRAAVAAEFAADGLQGRSGPEGRLST